MCTIAFHRGNEAKDGSLDGMKNSRACHPAVPQTNQILLVAWLPCARCLPSPGQINSSATLCLLPRCWEVLPWGRPAAAAFPQGWLHSNSGQRELCKDSGFAQGFLGNSGCGPVWIWGDTRRWSLTSEGSRRAEGWETLGTISVLLGFIFMLNVQKFILKGLW